MQRQATLAIHPDARDEARLDAGTRGYALAKRGFDIVVALALLVFVSPILLATGCLIALTSPGPVIFRQARCGRGGRQFTCFKFRTMVNHAERVLAEDERLRSEFAGEWKLQDDPRVTRLGAFLRKTSIDELPQLFNVLRGEMSIVGPRPVQPRELHERFGPVAPVLLSVKPGLTSLWATSGRSLLSYDERVALELDYVRRRSFKLDLLVALLTIPAVISGRGAV